MTRGSESDRFLLCNIGTRIAALALRDVRETMRPLSVEPLPEAPAFVLGLTIVRGAPAPVIDGHRLLSAGASPRPLPLSRFVSLKSGERTVVLVVDEVLDIRVLPREMLATIPPLLQEAGVELVSVIGALDARLLLVFEAARLAPPSVWSAIKIPTASI